MAPGLGDAAFEKGERSISDKAGWFRETLAHASAFWRAYEEVKADPGIIERLREENSALRAALADTQAPKEIDDK